MDFLTHWLITIVGAGAFLGVIGFSSPGGSLVIKQEQQARTQA